MLERRQHSSEQRLLEYRVPLADETLQNHTFNAAFSQPTAHADRPVLRSVCQRDAPKAARIGLECEFVEEPLLTGRSHGLAELRRQFQDGIHGAFLIPRVDR